MDAMPIGALSEATGVKVPTIRFYEQIGLLPAPLRTQSNRRSYGQPHLQRLRFIRHARDLGFSVDDIRELLAMTAQPQASCDGADSIARRHLGEVERRIAQLQSLRGELQRMIGECSHGRIADCRVIESLADHGQCLHEHA
jgi:DNA-binding transcriptional MerR regulator